MKRPFLRDRSFFMQSAIQTDLIWPLGQFALNKFTKWAQNGVKRHPKFCHLNIKSIPSKFFWENPIFASKK